jgi:hypothetical protein
MKRTLVSSSNLHSVGHDAATQKLHVQFLNSRDRTQPGKIYEYPNVSAEEHAALMAASSKGGHFHRHIKAKGGTLLKEAA